MTKQVVTFIAADPPMPPTGGGTRTLHFVKAISAATNCNLFVLFPVQKELVPAPVLNSCNSIKCSQTPFTAKSKGRINKFIIDIRLLIAPWSFPKNELILAADYFVTNAY